ncbi:Beta-glucosidase [Mycena venus]|uniref:beta-glucosidase n=1 Tax=Mycena venus TaxID=2733690 RepID=A0A8H6YEP3_9AGAR|nr:Beta-glucosidase [Mycena venus]
MNITPQFKFGFGLSYTTFGYSSLVIAKTHHHRDAVVSSSAAALTQSSTLPLALPLQPPPLPPLRPRSSSASISVSVSIPTNTTSAASAPTVSSSPIGQLGGPSALYSQVLSVSFSVQNTGPVAGNEVSQLYLPFPGGSGEPLKVLPKYTHNFLGRGQSKAMSIPLWLKDVSV